MGTITGYGNKHSHEFQLNVAETSYNIENNTSEISFDFTLYKSSYSWSGHNNIYYTVNIDGIDYNGTIPNYSAGSRATIRVGTQTIAHNSDGSKNISYSFTVTDSSGQSYTCGNAEASGNMNLTNIPRHTTVTTFERAKTVNSISINWYTTDPRDWTRYSLNGGEWQDAYDAVAGDNKSGYYIIGGLQPNTTYTIQTACRRADSGLWSYSAPIAITTFDVARITAEDFNLGEDIDINIINPSGQNIEFFMETLNGGIRDSTIRVENTVDGRRKISLSDSELDMIYRKFGAGVDTTIRIGVRTIGTYYDWQDKRCILNGNQKTVHIKKNNFWKRAKAFCKVNGTWKRAILWVKENDSWKKTI